MAKLSTFGKTGEDLDSSGQFILKIIFPMLNVSAHFALKWVSSEIFTKNGFSKSWCYILRKNDATNQKNYKNSCYTEFYAD